MRVYDMALQYYPRLWDESRLDQLVKAGKLTKEEMDEIIKRCSTREVKIIDPYRSSME